MIHHPVLKNGQWCEASFPVSSFKAVSPLSGKQLEDSFPVSSFLDLDEMLQSQAIYRNRIEKITPQKKADFLRLIAEKILGQREDLLETAHHETGFAKNSLANLAEMAGTIDYLKKAADCCLDENLGKIAEDKGAEMVALRAPLPGPVVIFGPSCSPFLYNSCCGVNFAAAVAAGNSIIAKGNPNHPATSLKLAEIVHSALMELHLPVSLFQFFHNTSTELGYRLAAHPMIGALSFTGSFRKGLALKENADRAGNPIYLELYSATPTFLYPDIIAANKEDLAQKLIDITLKNSGQTIHRPGPIFVVEDKDASQLIKKVCEGFSQEPAKPMMTDIKARNLDALVASFIRMGAKKITRKEYYSPTPFNFPNTVLVVDAKTYLKFPRQFQENAFGPILLFVTLQTQDQFEQIARSIEGCLCCNIFVGSEADEKAFRVILPDLRRKTGRICKNRLAQPECLSSAILQSGPFPATGHPGHTSQGLPAAIYKFTAVHCFEGFDSKELHQLKQQD